MEEEERQRQHTEEEVECSQDQHVDDGENEEEGADVETDDDIEYEVFYTEGEIDEVLANQRDDVFGDIYEERMEIFKLNSGIEHLKS